MHFASNLIRSNGVMINQIIMTPFEPIKLRWSEDSRLQSGTVRFLAYDFFRFLQRPLNVTDRTVRTWLSGTGK